MISKPFEINLTCNLEEPEILALGKDLGNQIAAFNDLEAEKTSVVKEYNMRLTAHETIINRLARIQQTGQDERPVNCEWHYHIPKQGEMTMVRLDNNTIVESREMRDRDYDAYEALQQLELDLR